MATTPANTVFLRVDPVDVLERFTAELDRLTADADTAMRDGRARDALLAAGAMQSLLAAWKDRLADALVQTRSKRVPPAVRAAARAAADRVLPALGGQMRALEARIKVHRVRQAAIGAALRAASNAAAGAPALSYGPGARYGARPSAPMTRHALAVTV
ncbi:hypothetical protein [Azospirillum doebereinerae]|uniref:Flagellar protein FlgN n=1 Tax=Azospirillum doebereinerae TaxID=92933 RepID=A0A433J3V0_9PROT|nr:hypothetical protein [Azospirillum doebereinerae]RUQ66525.1 hypothetical protein EJ913_22085 [Azospirillum doebereinerae]